MAAPTEGGLLAAGAEEAREGGVGPEENLIARRRFLRAAALAGVTGFSTLAGVSGLAPRTAMAGHEGDNVFHLGEVFNTFGKARLSRTEPGDPVMHIVNTAAIGSAVGVFGHSQSAVGTGVLGAGHTAVAGTSTSPGPDSTGVMGATTTGSGPTFGVDGQVGSTEGTAVRGRAVAGTGSTFGVVGESLSSRGTGVRGFAPAFSGLTRGVFGQSDSSEGRGVEGVATALSGVTRGVHGMSSSSEGIGVFGEAPSIGVHGQSSGDGGIGVEGIGAEAEVGDTVGVSGRSFTPQGIGVKASGPIGLHVEGKSRFSTVGNGQIPQGVRDHSVNDGKVGANTYVCVQFNSDPGFPLLIRFIERIPGTGFIIHLVARPGRAVDFSYWFADPV